jgi:hypothetical protein
MGFRSGSGRLRIFLEDNLLQLLATLPSPVTVELNIQIVDLVVAFTAVTVVVLPPFAAATAVTASELVPHYYRLRKTETNMPSLGCCSYISAVRVANLAPLRRSA